MRKRRKIILVVVLLFVALAASQWLLSHFYTRGTTVFHSPDAITAVAFSPDGKFFASGHRNGSISFWDPADWKLIETLDGHSASVRAIAFSPDSMTFASAGGDRVLLWDVASRQIKATIKADFVESLFFAQDGELLVFEPSGDPVQVWDIRANTQLRRIEGCGGQEPVGIAMAPNGKVLVLAPYTGGTPGLWDISSGQRLADFAGNESRSVFLCVSLSPNGRTIATGTWQGRVLIWDVDTRKQTLAIDAAKHPIAAVAFSSDSRALAVAESAADALYENMPELSIWDPNNGEKLGSRTNTGTGLEAIAFSPDGNVLVGGSLDGTLLVWRVGTR